MLSPTSNYLLASLPAEALCLLELEPVVLPQGTPILEPKDPIDRIYFPETGMISLLVVTSEAGAKAPWGFSGALEAASH